MLDADFVLKWAALVLANALLAGTLSYDAALSCYDALYLQRHEHP